jgi:hypothetical protein
MSMSSPELSSHYLQLSIPVRDPSFYISDGNTILLVENTLFKVSPPPERAADHHPDMTSPAALAPIRFTAPA